MENSTTSPAAAGIEAKVGGAPYERSQLARAILGSSAGNLVEYYDFYAYAFFAIYFAPAFFPNGDSTTQLLSAAGVFAVGFLGRPIGAWVFGWFADTYGRKNSLIASIVMMSVGSLVIAVLPTYESIGVAAPVLLVAARLFQGLSVGGEYGTAATYLSEIATPQRRGFFASFQYVTVFAAQLVTMLVVLVMQQLLSAEELTEWGWRIPFAIGALGGLVVLYLRRGIPESATKDAMASPDAGSVKALGRYRKPLVLVIMFTMGGSLYFLTFTTYLQKLLVNSAGLDPETVSGVLTLVVVIAMFAQPLFGALSDKIGRKNQMIVFGLLAATTAVPVLSALSAAPNATVAFAYAAFGMGVACFYSSISGILKAELFPPHLRALGVGLPYAIANASFGGTAEFIALSLKDRGSENLFYWYVAATAVVSLVAALLMPDTRKRSALDT